MIGATIATAILSTAGTFLPGIIANRNDAPDNYLPERQTKGNSTQYVVIGAIVLLVLVLLTVFVIKRVR